jgi:hypothetical protein
MKRLAFLAAAVLIPLIPAAPAYAVAHVICVNNPSGVSCDEGLNTIPEAITSANLNAVDPAITIVVAPGSYNDGPYHLAGNVNHSLTLQGQGSTLITLDPSASTVPYVSLNQATLRDVTVLMSSGQSAGDVGVDATGSTITGVTVDGSTADGATGVAMEGSTLSASTVEMPRSVGSNTTGVNSLAADTVVDTSITADVAYQNDSPSASSSLSRVLVRAGFIGIQNYSGSLSVDDVLVDLGTGDGVGLLADNPNGSSSAKSINANHVTVVGGGSNSVGVSVYARFPGAIQESTLQLTNSIVRGPHTDLTVEASNAGGLGAKSIATLTTSYSDWSTKSVLQDDATGTATLSSGPGHQDVNPSFRNASLGDYRLAAGSPLIDKGAPGTGAPTLDLNKGPRVLDGNGDGTAVRDMGAYEAPKKAVADTIAPNTTITSHPKRQTTKHRVTFAFVSTEVGSTFQCKLDTKPWRACTSPKRYKAAVGWHKFKVRAIDKAGNVDPTPARFRFHRAQG